MDLRVEAAWHGARPVPGALDLRLGRGEVVAQCRPSGVGKTTLLRLAAGLHDGWRGTRTLRGRLAMVFQEPVLLLPWRTAAQNIALVAGCDDAAAQAALREVGPGDRAGAWPGALSLGQQRRLSLARAMAARPDLMLLDEPFASLDAGLADEMVALLQSLQARHGFAGVLVTHDESQAVRLAQRVLRLRGQPARPVAWGLRCSFSAASGSPAAPWAGPRPCRWPA
jgi:NitT/TauT family transport system ATP-binding protein